MNFTNNFVWFALTFWAYLETKTVMATAIVSGSFLVITALSAFWFGSIVDHNKKKRAMQLSSVLTATFFALGLGFYLSFPSSVFSTISTVHFWVFVIILLLGTLCGGIRNISLAALVTLLVPEDRRDKANGLIGTVTGIAFSATSIGSGLALARLGMSGVLVIGAVLTLLALIHISFIDIPEKEIIHTQEAPKKVDIKGTIAVISGIPGLFALICFNTLNNLLGGVFMSLMDAYGLNIVSVEVWGIMWGFLSIGFILGGVIVAKKGLGTNPLRSMLLGNIVMWVVASLFTVHSWIGFLLVGMFIWICLVPFIEAAEQTVLQKVVPYERQGRVFGFAQSVEQSASPLVAFLIGPIAQYIFIPFMTTGAGVELIGGWFGVGISRGLALVFTIAGIIGFIVALLAINSKAYKLLSARYLENSSNELNAIS